MLDIRDHGGTFGGLSGSNIKSIQKGESVLFDSTTGASTDTEKTVTINEVDISKSVIVIENLYNGNSGTYGNGDRLSSKSVAVRFLSPTSIQFLRGSGYGRIDIRWSVIELKKIKSKQSGSIVISNTLSNLVNINSVNPNKSFLFFSFASIETAIADMRNYPTQGVIFSNTQLSFRQNNSMQKNIYWQLIELE